MFDSIPDFYPPDVSSTPSQTVTTENIQNLEFDLFFLLSHRRHYWVWAYVIRYIKEASLGSVLAKAEDCGQDLKHTGASKPTDLLCCLPVPTLIPRHPQWQLSWKNCKMSHFGKGAHLPVFLQWDIHRHPVLGACSESSLALGYAWAQKHSENTVEGLAVLFPMASWESTWHIRELP